MKDVPAKVTGDQYLAQEFEKGLNEESKNLVESSDQVLSEADQFQMAKAVANYSTAGDFFVDSGAADAYVLSAISPKQEPTKFFDGMRLRFNPANSNTGTSTVNPFALGVKSIKHETGRDLVAGEIIAGKIMEIAYIDSAGYFILSDIVIDTLPTNYITGLYTELGVDPQHDIQFFSGKCRDSTNILNIDLLSTIVKQIDANWAAGTGNGGFPSGLTLTADTWYHLFVIAKPDGTVDAGFDSASNASNLLADATGYTGYRRVGSVFTDGSSNIISYRQSPTNNDFFFWNAFPQDVNDTNPGTSIQNKTMSIPPDAEIYMILGVHYVFSTATVSSGYLSILHPGVSDQIIGSYITSFYDGTTSFDNRAQVHVLSNSIQQMKYRLSASNASTLVEIWTHGWIDPRGK